MRHITPRRTLALNYFLYFGALGVYIPYFNPWFRHLGLSPTEIGWLTGVRSAAAILLPLLWAWAADRYQARRSLFILANAVSAFFFTLYYSTVSYVPLLLITALYAVFYCPVISYMEAFSMEILGRDRNGYGAVRVWGSLSFIAVVMLLGRLIGVFPITIILHVTLAAALLQTLAALRMPASVKGAARLSMSHARLFFRPGVLVFFGAAFLMLTSHGAYYAFYSIHMAENLHFSYPLISLVWALGTVAEMGVFLNSRAIFNRFRPQSVMVFALAVAAARWTVLAAFESPWVLVPAQALHAATYGAFHVSGILYVEKLFPPEARTAGQAVNGSVTYGAGLTAGGVLAGYLYENAGAAAMFYVMAGLAGAGLLLFAGQAAGKKSGAGNGNAERNQ
jgi:PPP family 3-phenylpropionic acid transporter